LSPRGRVDDARFGNRKVVCKRDVERWALNRYLV
jgi:hypothetical protein